MGIFAPALAKLEALGVAFLRTLPNIAIALLVLLLAWAASRGARLLFHTTVTRAGRRPNVALLIARLGQATVFGLGFLLALVVAFPSFRMGNAVQLLGIGSVAIGFAFRDILQNFLSGVLLLWTEPFRIGDQIRYKDFEGTVEDIQTRASFIRTYDGRRVVIPNAELFTNAVTVNTVFPKRRIEYDVAIGTEDDIEKARAVTLAALQALPEVERDPPPDVLVWELADFSVKLRVRWWISPPRRDDALTARNAVLQHVKTELVRSGIHLPFPTTRVLLDNEPYEDPKHDRRSERG